MKSMRDAHEHRRPAHQSRRSIRQPNILIETAVCVIEKVENTRLLRTTRASLGGSEPASQPLYSTLRARGTLFHGCSGALFGWPII